MKDIEVAVNKIINYVLIGILGLLTLLLLLELILSLNWRMQHDAPLLHYVAFLIDKHGFIPYKDVFETSMVGTILFHLAIGKLLGYGDFAFRLVDITYLSFLSSVTWLLMRPFGKLVAFTSLLLFGLLYLGFGPLLSLQRDYIGILPIAMAILLVTKDFGFIRIGLKAFAIGALFALSASIKPHLAIGLPAIIIYMSFNGSPKKQKGKISFCKHLLKFGFLVTLGFLLFLSLPFLWLWNKGGFPYFWEMFSTYLPLYLHLTDEHVTISGVERWIYLFKSYRNFGGLQILLVPAALGIYIAFFISEKNSSKIKLVLLLSTLLVLYSIYPVFAGQFWKYHYMPFVYFGCLCASLILLPFSSAISPLYRRVIPLVIFAFFLLTKINPGEDFVRQLSGHPLAPPKEGRVDEIADFLKEHLKPNDKVQPLDWTGGAVHGMLISEAVIGTPYIYDYHFYHHISEPYIQKIRRRFIERLKEEKPRFIIDMAAKPSPKGKDTSTEFPELQKILGENYIVVYKGNRFIILERKFTSIAK